MNLTEMTDKPPIAIVPFVGSKEHVEMTYIGHEKPMVQISVGQRRPADVGPAVDATGDFTEWAAKAHNLTITYVTLFSKVFFDPETVLDEVVWAPMAFSGIQAARAAEVVAERPALGEAPLTLQ